MSEDISAAIEWANEYGPGASVNNYPAVLVKALTESRREVEEAKDFVYKMNPSPMYVMTALAELVEHRKHQFASGLNIYAWKEKAERLEAENATLRQEVERLKADPLRPSINTVPEAELKAQLARANAAFDGECQRHTETQAERDTLRRQVEEQAAKLAEKDECHFCGDSINAALARAEQAESSLAAMTRERDEALAVVAEYKFGQTASARILGERDAAQSRAEALEKFYRLYENSGTWRNIGEYGEKGSRLELTAQEAAALEQAEMRVDAALAAPSEPKEGA
jgi:hypothetical protein